MAWVGRGHRRASARRRSSTAACSTASRRTPGASPAPRPPTPQPGSARRRTRRPRPAARPDPASNRPRGRRSRPPRSQPQPQLDGLPRPDRHLVPGRALACPRAPGSTVSAPSTTWSLMPSFGIRAGRPAPRRGGPGSVSLSQNSSVGSVPSGPGPASSSSSPRNGCGTATDRRRRSPPSPAPRAPGSHDHVLRNHERRQHVQHLGVRTGVGDLAPSSTRRRVGLRVVHLDNPVAVARRRRRCPAARTPGPAAHAGRSPRRRSSYGNARCG